MRQTDFFGISSGVVTNTSKAMLGIVPLCNHKRLKQFYCLKWTRPLVYYTSSLALGNTAPNRQGVGITQVWHLLCLSLLRAIELVCNPECHAKDATTGRKA